MPTTQPTQTTQDASDKASIRAERVQKARTALRDWGTIAQWRRRAFGVMRLTGYVFCAALLCAAVGTRVVYADLREGTLQAGRELASLGDVLGTTKTIFLNGTAMNVSNAVTDQPPKVVLDRFESICREHPQFLARALAEIPETLHAKIEQAIPDKSLRLGVMRSEANGDGALTCFMDDRSSPLKDLPGRMKAFIESSDLSEFGRLRYVYANAITVEGAPKTRVTTVWADGELNLKKMFPAQGDAAGNDTVVVSRPPDSRRILSAAAAQVPFGVYVYDSADSKQSLRSFYDTEMRSLGWTAANGGVEVHDTIVYVADAGNMLYVTLTAKDRHTVVTATETSRDGTPAEVIVHVQN